MNDIYSCDVCGKVTDDPRKTDDGLVCYDCAEEMNARAEARYDELREDGLI